MGMLDVGQARRSYLPVKAWDQYKGINKVPSNLVEQAVLLLLAESGGPRALQGGSCSRKSWLKCPASAIA